MLCCTCNPDAILYVLSKYHGKEAITILKGADDIIKQLHGAGREKVMVPKLALGAAAGAAEDAWTIKAHAETSSQIEVRRATVDISNAHIGQA